VATLQRNILGAEAAARAASAGALRPFSYDRRTCGTRDLKLEEPTSEQTGYWVNPSNISSKPPRWIVNIDATKPTLSVNLACNDKGDTLQGAGTVGYINNGQGRCALAAFRLMPSLKLAEGQFTFPEGWEWIVQFAFGKPLPVGTSGDSLSDFSVENSEIAYKGRADEKSSVKIQQIGLVMTLAERSAISLPGGGMLSYLEATDALFTWFASGTAEVYVYDPDEGAELSRLEVNLAKVFAEATFAKAAVPEIIPSPELFGIPTEVYSIVNAALRVGKRHFIFHGPPGTGKTTLAQYIAESLGSTGNGEPYTLLTGSSSWSSQDLVGGYQPLGPGKIGFIPGVMLREFERSDVLSKRSTSAQTS
jgi:5-methylcytosine-specific restriction protein B